MGRGENGFRVGESAVFRTDIRDASAGKDSREKKGQVPGYGRPVFWGGIGLDTGLDKSGQTSCLYNQTGFSQGKLEQYRLCFVAETRILADHPGLFFSDDIGCLNPLGAGVQTGHTLEAGMNGFLVPVSGGKLPCGNGPDQIQPSPGGKGFNPFLTIDRTDRQAAAASLTLDLIDTGIY
jgi:hypothetical protein